MRILVGRSKLQIAHLSPLVLCKLERSLLLHCIDWTLPVILSTAIPETCKAASNRLSEGAYLAVSATARNTSEAERKLRTLDLAHRQRQGANVSSQPKV